MPDQAKYLAKLRNKRILVIGGSAGIGYAVAEAAIEHGAFVIISSSNPDRVNRALQSLHAAYPSATGRAVGYSCDMSDESALDDNIARLFKQSGKLDHIVYTAGETIPIRPLAEATVESIKSAATTRYIAPILVAKHAPDHLTPGSESSITLTTGVVTEKPIPNWSTIAGARSAVLGLGRNLALDLKPIRVNVVCVGAVDTETWAPIPQEQKEKLFEGLVAKSTTGRIAEASDVAEAYLYCMKDRNVTGSVISTNGGVLLT